MNVQAALALCLALANLTLSGFRLRQSFRSQSFLCIIWFLCSVFAAVVAMESLVAPVYLTVGVRTYITEADVICEASLFMLLFNIMMALSESAVRKLLPKRQHLGYLYRQESYPKILGQWSWMLTVPLLTSLVVYLKRVSTYTHYTDRYLDVAPAWEMVILVACWSILPIALVFRQRVIVAVAIGVGLITVEVTQVRYFALFYIVPAIVYALLTRQSTRPIGVKHASRSRFRLASQWAGIVAILAFASYAGYVNVVRIGSRNQAEFAVQTQQLPEIWLAKGFYSAIPLIDRTDHIGLASYTRLGAGILFPYLAYFTTYQYPLDTTTYLANLVGGFALDGIDKWSFLIYCDAYYSFGFAGCLLGALWGIIYTLLDYALTSRRIFVFMMPFAVWFYYNTYRGAVSNAILAIPREIYINVGLMIVAAAFVKWPRRAADTGRLAGEGAPPKTVCGTARPVGQTEIAHTK